MALSGSYTYTVPNTRNYLALTVKWTATQNVAANTSTVKATLVLNRRSYGAIYSSNAKPWTISINGAKTNGSTAIAGGNNSNTTLGSATTTVPHNADGSKSFSISFNLNFGGIGWVSTGATLGLVGGGNAFTLNTIPRASSYTAIYNAPYGAVVSININSHSSSFTQTIVAKIGSTAIQTWTGLKGGMNNLTWNSSATTAITNALKTVTAVQITWVMTTLSGTTTIGSAVSSTSHVSLPATELTPSVGTFSVAEANTTAASAYTAGKYIQGISKLKFSVSGSSATHGASISSTSISFEGASYANGATSNTIQGSGNIVATATVTDSRGQTASKALTVAVTAYLVPQIVTAIAMRTNSSGGFVSDGTYCTVSYSITTSALPLKTGGNYPTISIAEQLQGASGWTQVKSIPYTTTTATATQVLGSGYDGTKAYNIRITATDKAGGTNQVVITLDVAHVLMSWGKTQVGIGKVATQGTLDVLGDTYLEGGLNVSGAAKVTGAATLGATTMPSATISGAVKAGSATVGGVAINPTTLSLQAKAGTVLWQGIASMDASQTITPSVPLSKCLNGWLLVHSGYNTSTKVAGNGQMHYSYISKVQASTYSGAGVSIHVYVGGKIAQKYYYTTDTTLKGLADNVGTIPSSIVLRQVIAW